MKVYHDNTIIIIIIITGSYIAHSSSMRYYSKRFTVYYYPGHWIQYQSCTHSAPSQLTGDAFWLGATSGVHIMPHHATNNVRILPGTHLYTWVESSNAWIKCLAEGQKVPVHRTRNPLISESRVQFQYTASGRV